MAEPVCRVNPVAGEAPFPKSCKVYEGWPHPDGYVIYFSRLYNGAV